MYVLPSRSDGRIDRPELLLPHRNRVLERLVASNILRTTKRLELDLPIVQGLDQLFRQHDQHGLCLHVWCVHHLQATPNLFYFGQLLFDDEFLLRNIDDIGNFICKIVQPELQQVSKGEVVILGE